MNENQKPMSGKPVTAFAVSLIAGLWMLVMGGMVGWSYMGGPGWGGHMMNGDHMIHDGGHGTSGSSGWMWQQHEMMYGYGGGALWSWIGLAAGVVVLIGAVMLYSRPASARAWGVAILVVSALGLLAGAGGLLAGILGIIGGILAIAWRPEAR